MRSTPITGFLNVTGQITREDVAALAREGFGSIVNNRPDGEEPGQPGTAEIEAEAKQHGLHYAYIPVSHATITRRQVADYQKTVLRGPQPVLAYCRSGTRCYLLWAAARVLFEGDNALQLVAEAAAKGYDLRALPALIEKLEAEKAG